MLKERTSVSGKLVFGFQSSDSSNIILLFTSNFAKYVHNEHGTFLYIGFWVLKIELTNSKLLCCSKTYC